MEGFSLRCLTRGHGLAVLFVALIACPAVHAAEVKVLSGMGMRAVLQNLTDAFEQTTGHKLNVAYDTAGLVRDRLHAGEVADVAIMQRYLFDTLPQGERIVRDTPIDLARSPIGLAARAGAPRPDIGSVEGLKEALLAARSISYTDPALGGLSGSHFAKVLERLGLTEQMKGKTKLGKPMARVTSGEVEFAVLQVSEILPLKDVQFVGAFPAEVQEGTPVSVAVTATSREPEAATAFIKFLASPAAAKAIRTHGMEPIERK